MRQNNKLDLTFGPAGGFAGTIFIVVGTVLIFFHLAGFLLVVIGSFIRFTSTSTIIDFDKNRMKFSNDLFGIISTGRWVYLQPEMKLGYFRSAKVFRTYSRTNRTIDSHITDYRIYLYSAANEPIMPVKKVSISGDEDIVKAELNKLCELLGLKPNITV